MARIKFGWLRKVIIFPIKLYRFFISPLLGERCKFYPSCSEYAIESIKTYGVFKGVLKSIFRICRCNPWSYGGYDPVLPQKRDLNSHDGR